MALIRLRDIQLGFGGAPLLDGVNLVIERGERVCLLGRNGAGKSTLLKLILGELPPDDGERILPGEVRIAQLMQEVPEGTHGSVFDVVTGGIGKLAALVRRYHRTSNQLAEAADEQLLQQLTHIQHELEAADGWQLEQRVETVISRLALDPEQGFDDLSGGLKRRVLLAQALVSEPDLLLLDEPTNHLDIASIDWLETFLLNYPGALLFITHDRAFLRRLATRILELDRGRLTDWPGDYDNFLRRKQERMHAEALEQARFDKKLAQEEVWIRQGIKARRTRNEGRVRALEAMRRERRERRGVDGKARLQLDEAARSGRMVAEVKDISYGWEGKPLIRHFSTRIMRGDRIGVIGPNGVGKTTLLNLLLGRLAPDSGQVRLGTNLEVVFFDQLRSQLDAEQSVRDNVAGGSDKVEIGGKSKHIIGYLQDFLFTPERCQTPVKALSGGERNRLLLAKLFTRPANVLVMDEPTNDLDMETLELLEELLLEYQGTLLLVSHDRDFLDHVVTSCLVFSGDCQVEEFIGGYSEWEAHERRRQAASKRESEVRPKDDKSRKEVVKKSQSGKLSYKDQRELDALPARIEVLEAQLEAVQQQLSDPALYQDGGVQIVDLQQRMHELEQTLATAYDRWETLEGMQSSR
jgi:ATP-binding cassette subfamily F protein uup